MPDGTSNCGPKAQPKEEAETEILFDAKPPGCSATIWMRERESDNQGENL
jgi:hypothetical protein